MGLSAALGTGMWAVKPGVARAESSTWDPDWWDPDRPYVVPGKTMRVQPVLMYRVSVPQRQTSYKSWGGVQSHQAARAEAERIRKELAELKKTSGFPMEILPVILASTPEEMQKAKSVSSDTTIIYPASGWGDQLMVGMECSSPVIFARHRSGPAYYWYEALSVKYLETERPEVEAARKKKPRLSVHDVVIDDLEELRWRLRALYAMHNTLGARILSVGGVMGKYAEEAPAVAQNHYQMDLVDTSYEALEPRIQAALADPKKMKCAEAWTKRYLSLGKTSLETDRAFVVNAFVLYGLFKELMIENSAAAFTIRNCMATIMPMSETTACLSLSLMNDEGLLAVCESDFVAIPPAVLLYYLTDTPVFLHNSTFPHQGIVTCAHCTGPRRMDGKHYEPARILTHYESEYGAAPKVSMPLGQKLSFVNPEYAVGRWVGMRGTVEDNPFLEICRSQQDVRIEGQWQKLLHEVRDSHWLMVYGDHLRETGYAARRLGIRWDNISEFGPC